MKDVALVVGAAAVGGGRLLADLIDDVISVDLFMGKLYIVHI